MKDEGLDGLAELVHKPRFIISSPAAIAVSVK
jgi:hypothetical protein